MSLYDMKDINQPKKDTSDQMEEVDYVKTSAMFYYSF